METIKSYTDINQSKKLAEILPLESADMYYSMDIDLMEHENIPTIKEENDHFILFQTDIPCWSLAALMNVLPNGIVINKDARNGKYHVASTHAIYVKRYSLIDACYEIIILLHEQKLL